MTKNQRNQNTSPDADCTKVTREILSLTNTARSDLRPFMSTDFIGGSEVDV